MWSKQCKNWLPMSLFINLFTGLYNSCYLLFVPKDTFSIHLCVFEVSRTKIISSVTYCVDSAVKTINKILSGCFINYFRFFGGGLTGVVWMVLTCFLCSCRSTSRSGFLSTNIMVPFKHMLAP